MGSAGPAKINRPERFMVRRMAKKKARSPAEWPAAPGGLAIQAKRAGHLGALLSEDTPGSRRSSSQP